MKVNRGVKHTELIDKMFNLTGYDSQQHKLMITCRYQVNGQYIALPIDDDESVDVMLDMTKKCGINCIEVYIEKKDTSLGDWSNICSGMNSGSFTQLLMEEDDANDLPIFDMGNDHVSLSPSFQFSFEGMHSDYEIGASQSKCSWSRANAQNGKSNDSNAQCSNVFSAGIRNTLEVENVNCVIEGTDINNDLIEDETEEDLHEIDATCAKYKKARVPEFTNTECANGAIISQWVPWEENLASKNSDQEFYVGQQFGTKGELHAATKLYSLKCHQDFVVVESSPEVLVLKCKQSSSCPWKLRASIPKGCTHFQVKKYKSPHTCVNPILDRHHRQLNSAFIGRHILEIVKAQLSFTPAAIQALISHDFQYEISYRKAWKAKMKSIEELFGDWKESYKLLPRYMDALKQQNPRTVVLYQTEQSSGLNQEVFKRVFWAFGPSIEGFKYCRPVISIDGTHLYGKYKGTLLIATSCDANNQLFPLAFAIVESENNDSWSWFMACLRERVTNRTNLCVISDHHIGILNAMRSPYLGWDEPNAHHRVCIRHLASNFNSKFHDTPMKNLLVKAARSNQLRKFNARKEKIIKTNPRVEAWLNSIPEKMWALAHDGGRRYGMMTTNLSEVFNSVLLGARSLPITACVECTFHRLNMYFTVRRQWAEEKANQLAMFPTNIEKILKVNGEKANRHEVTLFDHVRGLFRIKTGRPVDNRNKGGHIQVGNLQEKTCTCQKWQLNGIPCSHVIAACKNRKLDYRNLVDSWYFTSNYLKTWSPCFHPVLDESYWPSKSTTIMIPDERRKRSKRGRPQSTRLHNEMDAKEGHAHVTCGICRKKGHNRRTCSSKNQQS